MKTTTEQTKLNRPEHKTRKRSTFRVGPEEITHRTIMRDLLFSVYHTDLVDCLDRGGQTAVHTEYLVVYHRREGQVVKHLAGGDVCVII